MGDYCTRHSGNHLQKVQHFPESALVSVFAGHTSALIPEYPGARLCSQYSSHNASTAVDDVSQPAGLFPELEPSEEMMKKPHRKA